MLSCLFSLHRREPHLPYTQISGMPGVLHDVSHRCRVIAVGLGDELGGYDMAVWIMEQTEEPPTLLHQPLRPA